MKPEVSVIIVSYNVKQLLFTCLETLYKFNSNLNLEVIVIDNESKDGSGEMVKESFPKVHLIENNFNAGFSGANNQGMRIAKGEFIFLLNPDTEFLDDSLVKLVTFTKSQPEISLVAPKLLNTDHSLQISVWKDHHYTDLILETFYLNKVYDRINYLPEQFQISFEAKTISGAAMFFNRKLMDSIGMLDENYFWMEDIDFSVRAQKVGKVFYYRDAVIVHHSGQSQKKNYDKSIANQLISKLKFYKKNEGKLAYWLSVFACFHLILSRWFVFTILSPLKNIYRLKAKAYFYTYNRFFDYIFSNKKGIM